MTMRPLALMASLLALAACAGPETTSRFLLDPPATEARLPNRLGQTELREISLPQYAAGQEIPWQEGDGTLRSRADQVWADDPSRAMTRVLARQISELTGATVIEAPWPLAEGPQRRLEVRVERMLAGADGVFRLSGRYFVSPVLGEGGDIARRFDIAAPVEGTGAPAIARAQSKAVQLLAAQIAQLR